MTPENKREILDYLRRAAKDRQLHLGHQYASRLVSELESSWAENEKLREALRFYADVKNWNDFNSYHNSTVVLDDGSLARKALGDE